MDNLELSDHFVMVESNKGDTYGYNSILGGLRKLSKTDLIVIDKIKKQEISEFIPFGPFIVIASIIVMFVPLNLWIKLIFFVFTLGKYSF